MNKASDMTKKHPRPHPIIRIEQESEFAVIEGQVLDGYDREGHKEIERRVAIQYNDYPTKKERVVLLGNDAAQETFLDNIFGEDDATFEGIGSSQVFDTFKVKDAATGHKEDFKVSKPVFNNKFFTEQLAYQVDKSQATGSPITTLVNCWPDGPDTHLEWFAKACPTVRVLNVLYGDPTGQGRSFAPRFGAGEGAPDNWEEQFPVMGECELPQPELIVDRFLNKGSIVVFAGRFETYKTMALIELSAGILERRKVFDEFAVLHHHPILFLEQDMSPELFQEYARPFGLMKQQDFRWQRPGANIFKVVDPVLQRAVRGRILILDTMLDYAQIEKAADSGEWIKFMQQLRELITVHGCISIIMTAHATKTGAKATTIDPSEYFKDSATFGGKVDVGYGFKPLDGTCQVQIERIKQRGFKQGLAFTIAVNDELGDSNLSRGCFPVCKKPGETKKLKGRPAKCDPELMQKITTLKDEGKSNREIATLVGVSRPTVSKILGGELFQGIASQEEENKIKEQYQPTEVTNGHTND